MAIDIGGRLARSGATTGQLMGGGIANLGSSIGGMLTRRKERRLKEEQELKQRGMMGGMLAAQQAATEGRFDTQTMKEYIGSLQGLGVPTQQIMATIPALQQTQQAGVLNNKQNQLVGLQQQLNEQANILLESDDISRKEAANFYIDTIEEQMVEIAKDTRGIDAAKFVGVGDKTRAAVTRSQLAQIETNAKISGAQQQMAISALERLQFGTEAWNVKAAELEQAGFRKAVQTVRESQQKIQLANKQFEEDMSTFTKPTPAQIKEMEDGGITVPQDAIGQKKFKDEIIKLQINNNKENVIFDNDEHPRNNLIIDDLKKLKTVFKENGTVTPGNSSGINDGAAATVLMTRKQAELKSIEPLVKVVSWASCGVEPSLMGLGPIPAVKEALNKADWNINDVDLFEINEAFAAQSIAVVKELKIPAEKVNVNGGAIALGHPIGASGTRILVTLIHEMIKQNKSKGCAALCIGGGMGIAMCVERN